MFDATNLFPRLNLKLEIAEVDRRLSELGELANPTSSPPAASATIVPEGPFDGHDDSFATKVAYGMAKSRMNSHHKRCGCRKMRGSSYCFSCFSSSHLRSISSMSPIMSLSSNSPRGSVVSASKTRYRSISS
jgi:hypothetical protein